MGVPVEAQSLSKLNYLLANPPQYPRNPTHEAHEPLVLYIVRVPGSRDVFLTPLKPPTKASISLEAIQTSLYYLHVNGPDDEEVKQLVEQERIHAQEAEAIASTVHRKPLPTVPHATYPASQRPLPPPRSYPSCQPGPDANTEASQLDRYVTRGSNAQSGSVGEEHRGVILRKPVGPRKFPSLADNHSSASLTESDSVHSDPSQQDQARLSAETSDRPPSYQSNFPPFMGSNYESLGMPTRSSDDSLHEAAPPPKPARPVAHGTGDWRYPPVTLIRRDPSSGVQWNIGLISDGGELTESSLRSVRIALEAPGYVKFNVQQGMRPVLPSGDADAIKEAIADARDDVNLSSPTRDETFFRTVEFRQQGQGRPFRLRSRTDSMEGFPNYPIQNKPPRSVFSFHSPWQGLCSFSNGIDGKSLKCRHVLPSPHSGEEGVSASIAEVRFNFAWSALSPRDPNRGNIGNNEADTLPISQLLKESRGGKEVFRRGINHIKTLSKDLKDKRAEDRHRPTSFENEPVAPKLPPRPRAVYDTEERYEHERLSLKLGREKAGGGYKGNSAKLGKLIIEDEGLKMGDLVVAACMGVWWQHYVEHER